MGGKLFFLDIDGTLPAGNGMVRSLYSREHWMDMAREAGFTVTDFVDARSALTEMYAQMILDLGLEGAQRQMGLCLPRQELKNVSYMLLAARHV